MSTTIYNGYKFSDQTTLEDVFARMKTQGHAMREMANEKTVSNILARAARTVDKAMAHCLGLDGKEAFDALEEGQSPLGHAFGWMMDLVQTQNSTEANFVSCAASVRVMLHDTGLYALVNFRNDEMKQAFLAKNPDMSEFAYWNNTDEPEGMDYEQWTRRGRIWDEILDGASDASHAGSLFELVRQQDFLPWMEGVKAPEWVSHSTLEARAWRIASDAPQTGLNDVQGTGQAYRKLVELRENPPEEFVALCEHVKRALPASIPGKWLTQKRDEILATCQERVLQATSPSTGKQKAGPRI